MTFYTDSTVRKVTVTIELSYNPYWADSPANVDWASILHLGSGVRIDKVTTTEQAQVHDEFCR